MGLFSSIGNALGLDSIFRTGATSATRDAQGLSREMQELYKEQFETVKPGILRGLDANEQLFENIRDPQSIAGLYGDVFDSINNGPLSDNVLQPLMDDRMDAAKQMLSASGLRRSGTAALEAAKVPTDVKMGFGQDLINKILTGLGNVTQSGTNFLGGGNSALQGFMGAGQLGVDAALGQADRKTNILSGLVSAGSSIFGAMSDPSLKTNIHKVGEYGDLNVYRWDWKEGVRENLGELASMNVGFLSDEVREKYPQHVRKVDIYGSEFDAIDYNGVLEEMAA
jgi:hypothetical protein